MSTASAIRTFAASLVLGALVGSCGPTTIEPVPDIPQTVDYDTVKIDYAGEDGVDPTQTQQSQTQQSQTQQSRTQQGSMSQALVGESSDLAAFTRKTVFGTNRMIHRVLSLIDTITAYPARRPADDQWVWETPARANSDDYLYFRIDKVGTDTFEYVLRWGTSAQDNRAIFTGWYRPFDSNDADQAGEDAQQGQGLLRIDFDAVNHYDPSSLQGKMAIAFRSRHQVRQVRVGFDQFSNGDNEPLDAIYRYVQFPSGRGRLVFFGRVDFDDQAPNEFLSVDAAWLPDRQGRVAARVEGGSLATTFEVRQCWDTDEVTVWEQSEPARPQHDGGSTDQCAPVLRALSIDAPSYEPPEGKDPEIPSAHPAE